MSNIIFIMTIRRILALTIIFILLLSGIRMAWIFAGWPRETPLAEQGVLDLRGISWNEPILLEGEWLFYPEQFLMPTEKETAEADGVIASLPGSWKGYFDDPTQVTGYGSYRLLIILDDSAKDKRLAVSMPPAMAASEIYVDGAKLGASGVPGKTPEETVSNEAPYTVAFTTDRSEVELVIQVSNFVNIVNGGLIQSIQFGPEDIVTPHKQFSIAMQLLVCAVLAMHMLYVAVLFFIGARQRALVTLGLMMVCGCLSILVTDDKLLLAWIDLPYSVSFRLYTLSYLWAAALLLLFINQLYPELQKRPWHRYYGIIVLGLTAAVVFVPTPYVSWIDLYTIPLLIAGTLYVPVIILRVTLRGDPDAIFLWLAFVGLAANLIWGVMSGFSPEIRALHFYPVDFIVVSIAFACYWMKLYFRNLHRAGQLAAELQKADKQKNDFLANTSHELRNPLHGMINIAQSVLEQETFSPKGKERLKLLVTVGKRMSLLLNDLLDLERMQDKGLRLRAEPVQVQAAVDGVIDMMKFMMDEKSIELRNEVPDSFPPVLADENRLVQILFNLLHNAVKFTVHGHIAIRGSVHGNFAVLEVEDTGIGMDEQTLQRIFQPYEQANSDLSAMGGLGLGLSIGKQLAELHGGSLEAESEPGKGSIFRLALPLASESDRPSTPPSDEPAGRKLPLKREPAEESPDANPPVTAGDSKTRKPRVLIVDDDPINLHILKGMLHERQYHISAVQSAHAAMKLLDDSEWDLVVTDVMMPQMSGYALTREIRRRFSMSELPVLLLTARNHPEDIKAGFQAGANDYVTKPADGLELQYRVRALTELKHSTEERFRLEAAFLQAQVQPHFLFNTLNSIAALSEMDKERMQAMLTVFGKYLRASFDFRNSERLVPLEHELKLVKAYLFIEQERFDERLRIQWEVPEALLSTPLPPLSIQTLVENGVRHGLMKRRQGGTLRIAAVDCGAYVEIQVSDDGIGMDEKILQQVLQDLPVGSGGIGLRNTNRRLRQIYGTGLDIQSAVGQGTKITFKIRKRPINYNE